MSRIEARLLRDLCTRAGTDRWGVSPERFADALERSVSKAFASQSPSQSDRERYLCALHLEDLALACACEDGHDEAWEHFVREYRPALYRAATAIDPGGNARDLADALYADLFGLREKEGVRQSLFRYFHGRSSLATWLRSVLSQRHVDRLRVSRRLEPLPEDAAELPAPPGLPKPDRARQVAAVLAALTWAIGALAARDRLRLTCYYAQNLTLAQIGRLTGEHEATVSRHLTRTRRAVRHEVEGKLKRLGMHPPEIAESLSEAASDPGGVELGQLLGADEARKDAPVDRSRE